MILLSRASSFIRSSIFRPAATATWAGVPTDSRSSRQGRGYRTYRCAAERARRTLAGVVPVGRAECRRCGAKRWAASAL